MNEHDNALEAAGVSPAPGTATRDPALFSGGAHADSPISGHEPSAPRIAVYAGLGLLMAMVGGVLGVLGALSQELVSGGFLAVITAAPVIEEALKPSGVYFILAAFPRLLFGRLHTALLAGVSGLCFALIESLLYVTVYFPDGGSDYVLFRFTVPVSMHVLTSFVMGLGLDRGIVDWAAGRSRFPRHTRACYLIAVALHAAYNAAALTLELSGWWEFRD